VEGQCGGFGGGQFREVLYHPAEAQALVVQGDKPLGVRGMQAVAEFFQPGLQRGQRGAQFVCDVGGEVAADLFGAGHLVGHGVERAGEFAEFAGAAGACVGGAVAGGETAGGGGGGK
jgi:hypothetical protein